MLQLFNNKLKKIINHLQNETKKSIKSTKHENLGLKKNPPSS